MTGYDRIKQLRKDLRAQGIKANIPDLLAMARNNDPFFAGSPASIRDSEWFAEMAERFSPDNKFHIRKIHYKAISQPKGTVLKPNGLPYENTDLDWTYVNNCSRNARYLATVDARRFRDKRNAEAEHYGESEYADTDPCIEELYQYFSLPSIDARLSAPGNRISDLQISGYDYDAGEQPYSLWLVIEKSTEDDTLRPICRRLGVSYLEGKGFQSITRVLDIIDRESAIGKPVRVFWLCDFDPAGEAMPVSMSRQIEFWGQEHDIDIKLHHLLLTREQCTQYKLPRTPIKSSDKRGAGWEKRYGEGVTELDALSALHRGELEKIVEGAIEPYFDWELRGKVNAARRETEDAISEAWTESTREEQKEIDAISKETGVLASKYQDELSDIQTALDQEMGPFRDRLESIQQAIVKKSTLLGDLLVDRPDSTADGSDETEWLYASDRDYMEQLGFYKRHKEGK